MLYEILAKVLIVVMLFVAMGLVPLAVYEATKGMSDEEQGHREED